MMDADVPRFRMVDGVKDESMVMQRTEHGKDHIVTC